MAHKVDFTHPRHVTVLIIWIINYRCNSIHNQELHQTLHQEKKIRIKINTCSPMRSLLRKQRKINWNFSEMLNSFLMNSKALIVSFASRFNLQLYGVNISYCYWHLSNVCILRRGTSVVLELLIWIQYNTICCIITLLLYQHFTENNSLISSANTNALL